MNDTGDFQFEISKVQLRLILYNGCSKKNFKVNTPSIRAENHSFLDP